MKYYYKILIKKFIYYLKINKFFINKKNNEIKLGIGPNPQSPILFIFDINNKYLN